MSEYLSKKAVLEWLKQEQRDEGWLDQTKYGFFWVQREIESGAFDAEQMENYEDFLQNYEDFQRKYEHYQTEIQRLRAENERYRKALERIAEIDIPYAPMTDHSVMRFYEQVAREALASTPTEPSGAERGATEVYVVRNRDKDILYVGFDWNEVESLLAQDASNEYLSYGIKAPEKEGEFE